MSILKAGLVEELSIFMSSLNSRGNEIIPSPRLFNEEYDLYIISFFNPMGTY